RRAARGPGDRLGPGHPHRRRDRVLRLALHPRRRRRGDHRGAGDRHRGRPHRGAARPGRTGGVSRSRSEPASAGHFTWRALAGAPVVAVVLLVAAVIACAEAGVSFRDPDNVAAQYVVLVGAGVALLVAIDVALRAAQRTGTRRPTREAMRAVRRERWTPRRAAAVAIALVSFYVTYLAYRNLKAIVPFLR